MKLDTPDDRSVAAGEYVLGNLGDAERREFEQALANDIALQAEVYAWQDRLLPLAARVPPAAAQPADWAQLESRLGPQGATATAPRATPVQAGNDALWQRLRRWQVTGVAALAASMLLAALLVLRGPAAPEERYLALLQAPTDNQTGWLVEVTAGKQVRLVPVGATAPRAAGARAAVLDQARRCGRPDLARPRRAGARDHVAGVGAAGRRRAAVVRADAGARHRLADRAADGADPVRRQDAATVEPLS